MSFSPSAAYRKTNLEKMNKFYDPAHLGRVSSGSLAKTMILTEEQSFMSGLDRFTQVCKFSHQSGTNNGCLRVVPFCR